MGVGKTGIGKALAALFHSIRKSAVLIDLDKYIEQKENCSVAEIFAYQGEPYFREVEYRALKELIDKYLDSSDPLILSLGGGTPLNQKCNELIRNKTRCFYLTCAPKELAFRLINTAYKRPLLCKALKECPKTATEEERLLFLERWIVAAIKERTPYYTECSVAKIDTTLWNKPAIAKKIAEHLL